MGHQYFEPSKRVGLCSFDLHVGGGGHLIYTLLFIVYTKLLLIFAGT